MIKISVKEVMLLFLLVVIFFMLNTGIVWKAMYPIKYEDEVNEASRKFAVDPYLALAIIQIESNFNAETTSKKGATGLMQLMPDTAQWAAEQGGFPDETINFLQKPEVNIHLGIWYLSFLNKQFNGNEVAVIAAYNAGPGNVEKWLATGRWDGRAETINEIPFGETRHYIQRVLYYYGRYVEIYDGLFEP